MEPILNNSTIPAALINDTLPGPTGNGGGHSWEFLVAVVVAAVSVSILTVVLAKCQVVRRYMASYRHTRLREADTSSQCEQPGREVRFSMHGGGGMDPHCGPPVSEEEEEDEVEEDDDGFIEDNYIPASERARAERAAEVMDVDTEEEMDEMDEIEFSIA